MISLRFSPRSWYGYPVREFIQGPGETLFIPGNTAHSIMNIEDNISITENYFLIDSLDDWVHGMMTGYKLMDEDSDGKDEERFWKSMYFKQLEKGDRDSARAMISQIESMSTDNLELCEDDSDESDAEIVNITDTGDDNQNDVHKIAGDMFDLIVSSAKSWIS